MRLYLDTEFNGFGGESMSLALVPADPALPTFYKVVKWQAPVDPWVAKHVVPLLDAEPRARRDVGASLASFMRWHHAWQSGVSVVADWPTDFEHLLGLLITGPGLMHPMPPFSMDFNPLPGFNTATVSKRPHNALADAMALRDYCEGLREGKT